MSRVTLLIHTEESQYIGTLILFHILITPCPQTLTPLGQGCVEEALDLINMGDKVLCQATFPKGLVWMGGGGGVSRSLEDAKVCFNEPGQSLVLFKTMDPNRHG